MGAVKTIILLAIIGLVVYGIYDEEVRTTAENKMKELGSEIDKYDFWGDKDNTTKKHVKYGIAQIKFVDSEGDSYQEHDLKVQIPSFGYGGYTDEGGEIKLYNVTSNTNYTINVTEGYGDALIYPVKRGFSFRTNMYEFTINKRASLKPIQMEYKGDIYTDEVPVLASESSLIVFDMEVFGEGVYKNPEITFKSNDSFKYFDVWMWAKHDTGLGLPEKLREGNIELNKSYKFKNSITEENYATYVLQIDRISQGTFQMCITDGVEEQCKEVVAS